MCTDNWVFLAIKSKMFFFITSCILCQMYIHCMLKKKNQKERCQSIFVDVWFEKNRTVYCLRFSKNGFKTVDSIFKSSFFVFLFILFLENDFNICIKKYIFSSKKYFCILNRKNGRLVLTFPKSAIFRNIC